MTTALTTYNDQMPALPSDAPLGYNPQDIDNSKIPLPRWRLVQALSEAFKQGKAKPGQLENSLTGEVRDAADEYIFVRYSKGAALFEQRGGGLICKSNDGIKNTKGDLCERCPHGSFYKNWGEDGSKPKCSENINLLAVRRNTLLSDMPDVGIVTFSKISFSAGMKILGTAVTKNKPIYLWSYKLNTEAQAKFDGAFAFKPISTGFVTNEELATLVAIAKRFGDVVIETDTKDEFEAAEEKPLKDAF